ncbi:MAG: DTW domain-containing protein [Pseudobdellovibrio sp.]|nr:DTW domain-containing protein [Pseudobdellovibrio sp.]
MNVNDYRRKKDEHLALQPTYRNLCTTCLQPDFGCYCQLVKPIDSVINFVILIHPIEAKRRIATGRMAHLCLKGSYLIKGINYTHNDELNTLIADPEYHTVIMYPGQQSVNISSLSHEKREEQFLTGKKLRILVIDGTWATARKMLNQSENLKKLPRVCFSPAKPSNFRVRKQPKDFCYSTIEAIHHTMDLFHGESVIPRKHDHLLEVFDSMVEKQLNMMKEVRLNLREATYRREGQTKVG